MAKTTTDVLIPTMMALSNVEMKEAIKTGNTVMMILNLFLFFSYVLLGFTWIYHDNGGWKKKPNWRGQDDSDIGVRHYSPGGGKPPSVETRCQGCSEEKLKCARRIWNDGFGEFLSGNQGAHHP